MLVRHCITVLFAFLLYIPTYQIYSCGISLIRLRQPLNYYRKQYNDPFWGLNKLYILMEKQRNRGQDGAGIAVVKFDMPPGEIYLRRTRSAESNAIEHMFSIISNESTGEKHLYDKDIKQKEAFAGELYLGHVRYGTYAGHDTCFCQPFVRKHAINTKHFAFAGNFNMTNTDVLFNELVHYGITPTSKSDTQIIMDMFSYHLDREHGKSTASALHKYNIHEHKDNFSPPYAINLVNALHNASQLWDGGYVLAAIFGCGDAFICRDPAGIRPAFWYANDEVFAAASERAALASAFNIEPSQIHTVQPGHILIVKRDGSIESHQFTQPLPLCQCTFERIYFSRSYDPAIYTERKALGKHLAPRILHALDSTIDNAIFSYIPNTSEIAFLGMIEEINTIMQHKNTQDIWSKIHAGTITYNDLKLLYQHAHVEKIPHKDQLMRTFITQDKIRGTLVRHTYDVTREIIKPTDTLIVIDDSIVRGTTLRESIIKQLSYVQPKKIIIVSSAPPIMYPDGYGIDMSQIGRFVAFQAAVELLKDKGKSAVIDEVAHKCQLQEHEQPLHMHNYIKDIYAYCTQEELETKIAQLVRPKDLAWNGELHVMYQTIDGLHTAMPEFTGDWYFTGNYPTPGGYKVLNTSFLNWYRGIDGRAY